MLSLAVTEINYKHAREMAVIPDVRMAVALFQWSGEMQSLCDLLGLLSP